MAKSFYNIIFTITVVIAILVLAGMAILMLLGKETDVWPPDVSECPDYWKVNPDGSCSPRPSVGNVGSGSTNSSGYNCTTFDPQVCGSAEVGAPACSYKQLIQSSTRPGSGHLAAGSPRCLRKNWTSACGVYWDGISDISPMYCGSPPSGGGGRGKGGGGGGNCDCTDCPSGSLLPGAGGTIHL